MVLRAAGGIGYDWDLLEGFSASLRIKPGKSANLELWSASGGCESYSKPRGTCIWCPQRYGVHRYAWRNGQLEDKGTRLTRDCLDPGKIVETPIAVVSGR
jgi:hypothetical protein